jgi:hypothetical protein
MHAKPTPNTTVERNIHVRLTPRSLAPRVLPALQVLGYKLREEKDSVAPDSGFWLVDETRLAELPDVDIAPDMRILLITSPRSDAHEDARILYKLHDPPSSARSTQ